MSAITVPISALALAPSSPATLARLRVLHTRTLQFPQISLATAHLLHGGMYARTIRLDPETLMNGSLILRATIIIIHGDCTIVAGDSLVDISGYNVLPGEAGRKQSFLTRGPVEITMIYATQAATVDDAENEVFGDADELMSRKDGSRDQIMITGKKAL